MLFNSIEFLIFFPVVTFIYFLLPHKFRWFHLLAASCYFYMCFVPVYILILFGTIIIDYFAGILIEKAPEAKKKRLLSLTVVLNVLVLCIFKYYNFFVDSATSMANSIGFGNFSLPLLDILLPIGLSFHTFQALSYVFEVRRGNIKAERHFGIYSLYVMFYPQLVAGPIERPQNMLHQFHEEKHWDNNRVIIGLKIMLWGFFKKLVIADRLAVYTYDIYSNSYNVGSLNLWLAVLVFFPIQLYCDFSGYSSIALGSAKVMGFNLMENFNKPFSSITTSEFWNRWHISLSSWFRDYLYQPIVVRFRDYGKWAVVIGLMMTFFLSGFWHGAGFGFIVYGLFQGAVISIEFLLGIKATKLAKTRLGKIAGITLTYFFFALSLVFFRSSSLFQAYHIIKDMFWNLDLSFTPRHTTSVFTYVVSLASIVFLLYFENKHLDKFLYTSVTTKKEVLVGSSLIIALIALGIFHNLSFIYFQF